MAVSWKKVEKNIYQCIGNPRKYKVVLYFGRDERNKLISSSKVIGGNLAFWCGCRREETCALEWSNVDMESREIKICQVRTTAKGTVVERKSTKNKEIRMVGIPAWLYERLVQEKRHQEEMKESLQGEYFTERDFVFCHDNGKPWNPNSV